MAVSGEAMGDEIRLTLPHESDFHGVAHLVVGGLAVRLNLTLEILEDLKLAVDELLDQPAAGDDVTVVLRVEDGRIRARVGPLDGAALRESLAQGDGEGIGLGRLLETLADNLEIVEVDGGQWAEVTKETTSAERS